MSKFTYQKRLIALMFALTYPALGALTLSARAQETDDLSDSSPAEVNVLKEDAPREFQQFDLKDPQTGEPISADKILTLPDGREVPAGEFYAELNRFEQEFNQLGYSLRDNVAERTIQESISKDETRFAPQLDKVRERHIQLDAEKVNQIRQQFDFNTIQQEVLQREQFEQELVRARTQPGDMNPGRLDPGKINPRFNPGSKIKQFKVDQVERSHLKFPSGGVKYILEGAAWEAASRNKAQSVKFGRSATIGIGDRSRFAAYLSAGVDVSGSGRTVQANANGTMGAYIFKNHANILQATANLNSPDESMVSARLNLAVFGQSVYSPQFTGSKLQKSDQFAYSIDKEVAKPRFAIGPIPMAATFGVRGSAGVRYDLQLAPRYASGSVVPFVNVQAYGQAGVDVVVAGAGLGVNLTLLRDELTLGAKAQVRPDIANRKVYFDTSFYSYNTISALSGNVYAYAYIYVPAFDIPPWSKKQWNWTIWNWNGFQHQGYLFNLQDTVALL